MDSQRPKGEAEHALQELRRLVHGIRRASYAAERSSGVTGAQLFVLRELSLEPGTSLRRLSERTLTDPSSVSVIVARLVERGLVTRERDPTDRRKIALTLSTKGAQLLARAPEPYQTRLIGMLRSLPPSDLDVLRVVLSSMSDALGVNRAAPLFFEGEK
ncbi:MAG: MarR family transcriptional regulator [Deltaproteobacteria bacterium]|nr:MarR family transcriptional regulator [Deltaproteobacteria bacterium]